MSFIAHWMMILVFLLISNSAHAYIGPGAGLSVIGSVIAIVVATLLLIVGFVWYPIKRMLRRKQSEIPSTETQRNASADPRPNQGSDES